MMPRAGKAAIFYSLVSTHLQWAGESRETADIRVVKTTKAYDRATVEVAQYPHINGRRQLRSVLNALRRTIVFEKSRIRIGTLTCLFSQVPLDSSHFPWLPE